MRCVIVDDEKNVVEIISGLLEQYCPHIEIVGVANDCKGGSALIQKMVPDLVFLDVEMGDGTGLDLIESLSEKNFQTIFITAHEKYALKAFKLSAIDFLLKPVSPDELVEAVTKAGKMIKMGSMEKQLEVLIDCIRGNGAAQRKIVLTDYESIHLVNVEDIMWCSAQGSYTSFKLIDGTEILVSRNLKSYIGLLPNQAFARIHHSYLVNINHIKRFERAEGGVVVMNNGVTLPVSVRKKDGLLGIFKNWNKNQL